MTNRMTNSIIRSIVVLVSPTASSSIHSGYTAKSEQAKFENFIELMRSNLSARSLLITHSYNELSKGPMAVVVCGTGVNDDFLTLTLATTSTPYLHIICSLVDHLINIINRF